MKNTRYNSRAIFKKTALGMLAAVTVYTSLSPMSAGIQANANSTDELTSLIRSLAKTQEQVDASHAQLISEYNSDNHSVLSETVQFKALFVKCNDVTMPESVIVDGEETTVPTRYVIGHDSDTDTVIDHGIARFEETVEDITSNVLDIVPTTIWIDDPVVISSNGFGYDELMNIISAPIPVDQYDSVFFFSAREGVYSTTGRGVKDEYGESYIQTVCVADEMQHIIDDLDVEEERKMLWTCGNMTHEWIHQLDISARQFLEDEHFPMCHDYIVEGGTYSINDLEETEENGAIYLTNPQNGYKWEYVPGKYPDYLGDYYEAFLAGKIIDTHDGNKKKGMFPALWKYIRDFRKLRESGDLGTYTLQNIKTGNFLYAADEKDRYGANKLIAVTPDDPFTANLQWQLSYDPTHAGTFRITPKIAPTQVIRSENGAAVDTIALYEKGWGMDELDYKNFSFKAVMTEDGNYQIKSTLSAFDGYNLCENNDGSVDLRQDDVYGTWKLTKFRLDKGDVNGDFAVDVADAVLVARFCAEDATVVISRQGLLNADVNHSGDADTDDVLMILKYIARILTSFD